MSRGTSFREWARQQQAGETPARAELCRRFEAALQEKLATMASPAEQHCPGCRGYTRDWESRCPGVSLEETLMDYARCNLDGRPLHPDDQEAIDRFTAWLLMTDEERRAALWQDAAWRDFTGISLEALRSAACRERPGLVLRELRGSPDRGYWQDWYCEPPAPGMPFRITPRGEEWSTEDGFPVRRIYAIEEITDAAAKDPGTADCPGPAGPGPGAAASPEGIPPAAQGPG